MYTSSIPCSCNVVNIDWVCTQSNAFRSPRTQHTHTRTHTHTHTRTHTHTHALTHSGMLYSRHFKLVHGMYVICRIVLAPKSCLFSRLIFTEFFSSLVVMIFVNSVCVLL